MCHGCYRKDLGLVCDLDKWSLSATVLLIPQIHLTQKREQQGCSKKTLFDAKAVQDGCGRDSVLNKDGMWIFCNDEFVARLIHLKFNMFELSDQLVNATQEEFDFF